MTIIPLAVRLPNESDPALGDPLTTLWVRDGTSDEDVTREVFRDDVYHLRGLDLGPYPYIIDVGACTGIFTALACQMFPEAQVTAIEPDPDNFTLLRRNVDPWADRVWCGQLAVGTDCRYTRMIGDGATGHTTAALVDPDAPGAVEQTTLQNVIADMDVALLKIDVEGAEYDTLDACPSEALALVGRIHMEWHGTNEAPWVTDAPARYGELLTKLAYTHTVQTFGRPDRGGYLFATRY